MSQVAEFRVKDAPEWVRHAAREYKGRRPVRLCTLPSDGSYRLADYWDGGSRTETAFYHLASGEWRDSGSVPKRARQVTGNPFGLPIADLVIPAGVAVVERVTFCGKDMGFRILVNACDLAPLLPGKVEPEPMPTAPTGGRWLDARWSGKCSACGKAIARGERALWYRDGKRLICQACGEQHTRDIAAEDFDQRVYDSTRAGAC